MAQFEIVWAMGNTQDMHFALAFRKYSTWVVLSPYETLFFPIRRVAITCFLSFYEHAADFNIFGWSDYVNTIHGLLFSLQ